MRADHRVTSRSAAAAGALAVALAWLAASGCSSGGGDQADASPPPSETAATEAGERPYEEFHPEAFADPTRIDNPWLPMEPGTRLVYEGSTVEDDGTVVPHRVEIHVTDLVKEVGGIPSRVSWDLDYSDGELVEAELAFFAQDTAGNVWRMGEYPEEYEEKKLVAHPAWLHGVQDARAGIMMPAAPRPGTPSYSQGWGPAVQWTDRGRIDQAGQKTCVPADCYEDVLVIAETSASEPGAEQLKYYARGVGNVRVGWRGSGEKTKETLQLVRIERLDAAGLSRVRRSALELEKSAYRHGKEVYGNTPPAAPAPPRVAAP